MKKLLIALIVLFPVQAFADKNALPPVVVMESANAEVSPGGDLRFIVYASVRNSGYYSIYFSPDTDGVVESITPANITWGYGEYSGHPRHVKVRVKDDISVLPRTVKVNFIRTDRDVDYTHTSITFYVKAGTIGHPAANVKDKHSMTIVADTAHPSRAWYELFCIGSTTGNCSFDIKDGQHDNYTGLPPTIAKHTCGDQGFPIRTLAIRQSLVFDSRKLIIEADADKTIKPGYTLVDNAVCVFVSPSRFMLRPIDIDHISTVR